MSLRLKCPGPVSWQHDYTAADINDLKQEQRTDNSHENMSHEISKNIQNIYKSFRVTLNASTETKTRKLKHLFPSSVRTLGTAGRSPDSQDDNFLYVLKAADP